MKKRRVLLVDDEEGFTQILKSNLESTGNYEVEIRNCGLEAHKAAVSFRPNLILLDIGLPDLNGSEVAEQIRNDENLRDVPIAFLSGKFKLSHPGAQSLAGFPFIPKPVSMEDLIEHIERLSTE